MQGNRTGANDEDPRIFRLIAVGLFLFFFTFYFSGGLLLSRTRAFTESGLLFEMDTPRVIEDMTAVHGNHYRTQVHPLFVLMLNGLGTTVSQLVGSRTTAAVVINSCLGALNVTLAFIFFSLLLPDSRDASLLAILFGVTASQLLLSIIPETATLGTSSLIVTYILFVIAVKDRRLSLPYWIIAGVFTIGATISNFVQTLVCFLALQHSCARSEKQLARGVRQVSVFLTSVALCAVLFSGVQKTLYPSSSLFFLPSAFYEDTLYVSLLVLRSPLTVLGLLLKYTLLVNIIAPVPLLFSNGATNMAITFGNSWEYTAFGWAAAILWVYFLYRAFARMLADRGRASLPLFIGFIFTLCIFFNLALHSVYGMGSAGTFEYFLYTGNFTLLVLGGLSHLKLQSKKFRIVFSILLLLVFINNMMILARIINVYR